MTSSILLRSVNRKQKESLLKLLSIDEKLTNKDVIEELIIDDLQTKKAYNGTLYLSTQKGVISMDKDNTITFFDSDHYSSNLSRPYKVMYRINLDGKVRKIYTKENKS